MPYTLLVYAFGCIDGISRDRRTSCSRDIGPWCLSTVASGIDMPSAGWRSFQPQMRTSGASNLKGMSIVTEMLSRRSSRMAGGS